MLKAHNLQKLKQEMIELKFLRFFLIYVNGYIIKKKFNFTDVKLHKYIFSHTFLYTVLKKM